MNRSEYRTTRQALLESFRKYEVPDAGRRFPMLRQTRYGDDDARRYADQIEQMKAILDQAISYLQTGER